MAVRLIVGTFETKVTKEFRLVPNQSEKCNYNPIWLDSTRFRMNFAVCPRNSGLPAPNTSKKGTRGQFLVKQKGT